VQNELDVNINNENLKKFVGAASFFSKRLYDKIPKVNKFYIFIISSIIKKNVNKFCFKFKI